jgi:NAD(P)H-dependent FMN reductase
MMQILAISGSLRATSTNTILLEAASASSGNVKLILYRGFGELPHFKPDLDVEPSPPSGRDSRTHLRTSAGVIISTPEYAHGVPGVLKNALDWVVRRCVPMT